MFGRLVSVSVVALLLAACGSPRRQYAQGAPLAPRPPAFSPTTDAPHTVGQPGHVRPATRMEPNPRPGRVLPETPETRRGPGIWASGAPSDGAERGPQILDVPLPIGDTLTDPKDYWLTDECAVMMDRAARKVVGKTKLSTTMRQCLAAQQYLTCTIAALRADGLADAAGDSNPHRMHVIIETGKTAARFVKHMCPDDIAKSKDLKDWADKITAEADRHTHGATQ
jgi:hypothetical protein